MQQHLKGARGVDGLLKAETFRKLQTTSPGGTYALGWGVAQRQWAGGLALNHSGSNTMFFALVWVAPAKDRIFVTVTNRGDSNVAFPSLDRVIGSLINKYIP